MSNKWGKHSSREGNFCVRGRLKPFKTHYIILYIYIYTICVGCHIHSRAIWCSPGLKGFHMFWHIPLLIWPGLLVCPPLCNLLDPPSQLHRQGLPAVERATSCTSTCRGNGNTLEIWFGIWNPWVTGKWLAIWLLAKFCAVFGECTVTPVTQA